MICSAWQYNDIQWAEVGGIIDNEMGGNINFVNNN